VPDWTDWTYILHVNVNIPPYLHFNGLYSDQCRLTDYLPFSSSYCSRRDPFNTFGTRFSCTFMFFCPISASLLHYTSSYTYSHGSGEKMSLGVTATSY